MLGDYPDHCISIKCCLVILVVKIIVKITRSPLRRSKDKEHVFFQSLEVFLVQHFNVIHDAAHLFVVFSLLMGHLVLQLSTSGGEANGEDSLHQSGATRSR